jgi:tetratricopeptide (TPR) repeat protein
MIRDAIYDAIYDLVARNRCRWFGRRDACITLASCRIRIIRAIVNRPKTAGRWRLAQAGMTKEAALLQFNSVPDAGEQLRALGHDDHPNVGNLIGYSYRKLGDYKFSQVWYERALKADPNHVLTWQYYGLWQLSRDDQAQENAERPGIAAGPFLFFER